MVIYEHLGSLTGGVEHDFDIWFTAVVPSYTTKYSPPNKQKKAG